MVDAARGTAWASAVGGAADRCAVCLVCGAVVPVGEGRCTRHARDCRGATGMPVERKTLLNTCS